MLNCEKGQDDSLVLKRGMPSLISLEEQLGGLTNLHNNVNRW